MSTARDFEELDTFFSTDRALSYFCALRMCFEEHVLRSFEFAVLCVYSDPRWIKFFLKHNSLIAVELLETLEATVVHSFPELTDRVQVDVTLLLRHTRFPLQPLYGICRHALVDLRLDLLYCCPPIPR